MGDPSKKVQNFLISCEHASNALPEKWSHLFDKSKDVLETHRGWDPGSMEFAELFADKLGGKLHHYPWCRLLIEPNRSLHHRQLFSEFTKNLTDEERKELIDSFWLPYRNQVRQEIHRAISPGIRVIHISVHTFAPVWNDVERDLDIGLLYDPRRKEERQFCMNWKKQLKIILPEFRIRMNKPYRGIDDGFTTSLRTELTEKHYLGIELEVNQKFWDQDNQRWRSIGCDIVHSLKKFAQTS